MQHGGMAEHNSLFDVHRLVGVGVNDAAVLYVDPRTQRNRRQVSTHYGAIPNIDPCRKQYVSRDNSPRRNIKALNCLHAITLKSG